MPPATIRRPGGGHSQNRPIARGPLVRRSSGRGEAAASVPSFTPADLTPALWADPSDAATVTISGSSGAYIGPNGLVSPSSGSNYTSTPSHAGIQVTGDIDVRAYLTVADWTPATLNYVLIKYAGAGGKGYGLRLEIGGKIGLYYGTGAERLDQSTVANTLTDGTAGWIRATHATGSGQTNFYQSTDGTNWTQIGTTVAGTAGALGTDTASLIIGSSTGTNNTAGTIHRVKILDGIDGTAVFDADFESATAYVSSFTESALGAPVYVVSSTATSSTASYGYVGPTGLVCPGTTGNYASTPHAAAISLANDMDIRVYVASCPTWTPAADGGLTCKKNSGSVAGWRFLVKTTGALVYTIGAVADYTSTASVPFTAGQAGWVRVTRQQSTGDIKFYTSSDGVSWSQLGTTVAGSTTTTLTNTEALFVGYGQTTGLPFFGTIGRVTVYSDLTETTKVFDANLTTAADYCTSFTESSANAATVTITATNTPANAAGACVSQVNDKSGNARHLTQGTLANMPKYWNGRNGCNCLVFDGSDWLRTASGSAVAQPLSIYGIYSTSTTDGRWLADQAGSSFQVVTRAVTTNKPAIYAGAGPRETTTALGTDLTMVGWLVDAGNTYVRINGAADAAVASPGTNSLTLATIGARGDNLLPTTGLQGEMYVVSGTLSAGNITSSESYLKPKWGTP